MCLLPYPIFARGKQRLICKPIPRAVKTLRCYFAWGFRSGQIDEIDEIGPIWRDPLFTGSQKGKPKSIGSKSKSLGVYPKQLRAVLLPDNKPETKTSLAQSESAF